MATDTPAAFFSYSRDDSEFALRLAKDLKAAGANVWLDKLDIRPGQRWDLTVEDALNNCPRMLVILSPASVNSTNVMDEVSFALEEQKTVIPVFHRECKIPFRLRRVQYVDFRSEYDRGLKDLLQTLLGGDQQNEASVTQPNAEDAHQAREIHQAILRDRQSFEASRQPVIFPPKSEWRSVRELRTLSGHSSGLQAVALTPEGGLVVSGSNDATLKVWELGSGRELRTLTGHLGNVYGVAVTPDGKLAVSASWDRTLKVWELDSGRELRTLTGHQGWVIEVAVTPDGKLAVSASNDKTLKVWEVGSGREVRTLSGHPNGVLGVAVTPDGQLAVSGSFDDTLKVWELGSGRELRTLTGHTSAVAAVAVTPDGQLAISASGDKMVKVWELGSGRELRTLTGHSAAVHAVAVTPDGQLAVSASSDKTLRVWEVASGRQMLTFTGSTEMRCCAVAPDGRTIVGGDSGGIIHCLYLE